MQATSAIALILSHAMALAVAPALRRDCQSPTDSAHDIAVRISPAEDARPFKSTGVFRICVSNISQKEYAVFRWRWVWELELQDGTGNKMSDEKSWRETIHVPVWTDADWIVLRPGDSCSFLRQIHGAHGPIESFKKSQRIVLRLHSNEIPDPPEWLRKHGAPTVVRNVPAADYVVQ